MTIAPEIEKIKNKISGKILFDESLSKFSWFNLGGPAKVIFKPKVAIYLKIKVTNMRNFHHKSNNALK